MTLTAQQRLFLEELAVCKWLRPAHFENWPKPEGADRYWPTITRNSASAVLTRLVKRGLVRKTGQVYRITSEGRRALRTREN